MDPSLDYPTVMDAQWWVPQDNGPFAAAKLHDDNIA